MDPRLNLSRLTALSLLALAAVNGSVPSASAQVVEPARRALPISPSPRVSPPSLPTAKSALLKAEEFALSVPTPENARAWLRRMTREPHVAGTAADKDTAIELRDKLISWGWDAELAEYEVLLNYPQSTPILQIVRPNPLTLKVIEDPFPLDTDSSNAAAFPAFHGYGVSGDVAGAVVYVNYGRREDFETLEKLGVDVKGKLVLVRYGEIFRGLKVLNSQKRGAIGVLIYSDPIDDGFMKGDVYPNGPYRPASAIQRGSVQFLSLGPGDPSTPNGPSIKGAKRLPIDPLNGFTLWNEADAPQLSVKAWEKQTGLKRDEHFATIPSLPLSYESAKPIFEALGGAAVPIGWQGGLPLTYHTGPGPCEVRFKIQMDYAVRTIWNVIARLPGNVEPDRWVMVGNHRDAWVFGAADPGSGTAATMEMCRALGAAVKNGWKPRRTIVYASWDAEEYGLVGSTEWADEHSETIKERAVMLLNVDTAVSGTEFDIDGVPSLRDFLLDAAGRVNDIRTGKSLKDLWLAKQKTRWAAASPLDLADPLWDDDALGARRFPASARFQPQLNALGSGSDYTAFVDHLGVPAIDVGFSGRYGVYHAIYDNFFWMEKFGDPEFVQHATAARLYTLIAMRAASLEVVPLRFTAYGHALREAVDDYRLTIVRKNRAAAASVVPFDFAKLPRLVGSIKEFQARASEADKASESLLAQTNVDPGKLSRYNDALTQVERAFLLPGGLPGRPWFRHAVYAPGLTTGYAAWVFPGLKQALNDDNPAAFGEQVVALSIQIDKAAAALKKAAVIAAEEPKEKAEAIDAEKDK